MTVVTPDLPSHSSATLGLSDDADAVRVATHSCPPPVVLVGWSYGGEVISVAGLGESAVCRLVYVSAVPQPVRTTRRDTNWIDDNPAVLRLHDGRSVLDTTTWLAEEDLQDLPADVLAHLRRYPRRPVSPGVDDPATAAAWTSMPTTIIVGAHDPLISDEEQHRASAVSSDVHILPTDHFIIFREPEVVANAVLRALGAMH